MTTSIYPYWITESNLGSVPSGSDAVFSIDASMDTESIIVVDSNIPGNTIVLYGNQTMPSCYRGNHVLLLLNGASVPSDTTYRMTLRAVNSSGITDQNFSITIQSSGGIVWNQDTTLPSWALGTQHNILLEASWINPLDFLLLSGKLPQGVYLDPTGIIYGIPGSNLIASNINATTWQVTSVANTTQSQPAVPYTFTIRARDKTNKEVYLDKTFTLSTLAPKELTTDSFIFTADSETLTADASGSVPVVILMPSNYIGLLSNNVYASSEELASSNAIKTSFNYNPPNIPPPSISLGTFSQGDNFIQLIKVWNPTGELVEFSIENPNDPNYQFASFLQIDKFSGYLNGTLPTLNFVNMTYILRVVMTRVLNGRPQSQSQDYTLTVNSQNGYSYQFVDPTGKTIDTATTYTYEIKQGEVSTLAVKAKSVDYPNEPLFYDLVSGQLPTGLSFTNTGLIVGKVSWSAPTGFYQFSVSAYDPTNRVSSLAPLNLQIQQFEVIVNHSEIDGVRINSAYDVYYRAFLPLAQKELWRDLISDSTIFNESVVYRSGDPKFGRRPECEFLAFPGISQSDAQDFVTATSQNFGLKRFKIGNLHTVMMNDAQGNYVADVVYVDIIDSLTNSAGKGPPSVVTNLNSGAQTTTINLPNQLANLKADPGQSTDSLLPLWMTTPQADGVPLGLVPAAVLCFVKPNNGIQVLKKIKAAGYSLSQIDFQVDRLVLKDTLEITTPTTFDTNTTVFDTVQTTFDVSVIADKYIYFNNWS